MKVGDNNYKTESISLKNIQYLEHKVVLKESKPPSRSIQRFRKYNASRNKPWMSGMLAHTCNSSYLRCQNRKI
jgi:hypothetical protein